MEDINQPISTSSTPKPPATPNQPPGQESPRPQELPSQPPNQTPPSPTEPVSQSPYETSPPPPQPTTPPPQPQPASPQPTFVSSPLQVEYAGFWRRFAAVLIDGLIVGFASFIINLPFGFVVGLLGTASNAQRELSSFLGPASFMTLAIGQLINLAIGLFYPLYFIGSRGQTLGKMAMKVKVLRTDQKVPPGYLTAFLREIVGKILSSLVFALGYLWMFWDEKKQTWHDKIANTIVVKVE